MFPVNEVNEMSVLNCAAFEWVSNTWDIVFNPWNHRTLMKDTFFINSLVFFMDEQDAIVIKKALEICYLLLQNWRNHEPLSREQYVRDGLSLAFKRYRSSLVDAQQQHLFFLCKESLRKLRDADYEMVIREGLELRDKQDEGLWGDTVVLFHVPDLNKINEHLVHRTLVGVGGVTSVSSDLRRCVVTLNVTNGFSTSLVRSTVAARLLLRIETIHCDDVQAMSVNFNGDVTAEEPEPTLDLPPYFPDVDSPVKANGAITTAESIKSTASGIVSWFRESFYW